MATLLLTARNICTGGNHVTMELQVNGIVRATKTYLIDELIDLVNDVEAEAVIPTLIRLHKIGRTNAQVRADVLAGLTITV